MTLSRRLLLTAPLLLAGEAAAARSRDGLRARLHPGLPPMDLRLVVENDPERLVRLRLAGAPATVPAGEIIIPTRYGGTLPLRVLRLGAREVILAEADGNGGTGISQRLGVVIALDDARVLRVIGIESLQIQDSTTCEWETRQNARLITAEAGLRIAVNFRRRRGECGFRARGRPHQESWEESLGWDGSGALTGATLPAAAGPVRRATVAARASIGALLAKPVADLRDFPWDQTGIFDLAMAGLP